MKQPLYLILSLAIVLLAFASCGKINGHMVGVDNDNAAYDSLVTFYNQAHKLQKQGKAEEAINLYKRCLQMDSPNKDEQLKMQPYVIEAMLQTLNSYQLLGNSEDCATYLAQLQQAPTLLVANYCMRDLHVIYAYTLYMLDGREKEAEHLIIQSLKEPLKGNTAYKATNGKKHNLQAERLFRDYSYAAAICNANPRRTDDVMRWCKRALSFAQDCNNTHGEQYVISMLSSIYLKQGEILNAITLSEDAIKRSIEKGDTLAAINSYNVLGRIFIDLGLMDRAKERMSEAVKMAEKMQSKNPMVVIQTYLHQSKISYENNDFDGAKYWIRKAETLSKKMPYSNGQCDVDYLKGAFYSLSNDKIETQKGIDLLNAVTKNCTQTLKVKSFFYLAKAYEKQNKDALCEAMLDSMYNAEHSTNPPFYIRGANSFAVNHYHRKGNTAMVDRYAMDLQKEYAQFGSPQIIQQISEDMMHEKMATENAEKKTASYRRRTLFALVVGIFALAIVGLVLYIINNHSKFSQRINKIKTEHEEALLQKEEFIKKLQNVQNTSGVRMQLLQYAEHLTDDADITRFENMFSQSYPDFERRLLESTKSLGKRERLVCKLVFLDISAAQISNSLGIAARSITIYRYRIRQKLKLKDLSIEEFIKSLS